MCMWTNGCAFMRVLYSPKFSRAPAGTRRRTPWWCQSRVTPVSALLTTAYLSGGRHTRLTQEDIAKTLFDLFHPATCLFLMCLAFRIQYPTAPNWFASGYILPWNRARVFQSAPLNLMWDSYFARLDLFETSSLVIYHISDQTDCTGLFHRAAWQRISLIFWAAESCSPIPTALLRPGEKKSIVAPGL